MFLDVRTMYIAMAATCFIVAAGFLALQARRRWRDGALQWTLGWAVQGAFWVLLGLRGVIGDFFSIVVANTCLAANFSFLYAAVRQFQGRPYHRGILFFHLQLPSCSFGISRHTWTSYPIGLFLFRSSPFCKSALLSGCYFVTPLCARGARPGLPALPSSYLAFFG